MSEVTGLRGRQRQARNDHIIEAAWALLVERGYAGWTLSDLADRAEVSRRTLYLHFSSKEEIAAETVARNMLRSAEQVRAVGEGLEPLDRLTMILGWFVGRSTESSAIPVGPIKAEPGLMATIRTFPAYQAAYGSLTVALARLISDAQEAGAVTRRFSPETLATVILQLLRGVDASYGKDGDLSELVIATLLDGLRGLP